MAGSSKSDHVREVFSVISDKYDLLDSIISFGMDQKWRKALVEEIPADAALVVDCGAGTGKLTSLILRRTASRVNAIDLTERMRRNPDPGRVNYQIGSAESLPYPDSSADCVVSAFLTRNLDSVRKYAGEAHRVLKIGGKFLNLDIFNPTGWFGPLFALYFFRMVPFFGDLATGSKSYSYLAESVKNFVSPEGFSQILADAGFHSIKSRSFALGSVILHEGFK
ncbi:MAG: class I SAM-dependent methyltransferase [Candidatus Thermoplasmatota archaeon]|nr:class I SAM-dependent methyltransferase [Candidatus Thermoplasmatota archaeon]